jgi:glycosyltransferase involved in cell wall biosynthesis
VSDAAVYGGAERYLGDLAEELGGRGWSATVLVSAGGGDAGPAARFRARGLNVVEHGFREGGSRAELEATARKAAGLEPDVLHLNFPWPHSFRSASIARLASRLGSYSVVATQHLPMVPGPRRMRLPLRWNSRRVHRQITVAEATRAPLAKLLGVPESEIRAVRNGIDPLPPERREKLARAGALLRSELGDQGRPVAVCLARLHPQKGHVRLLEAMVRLSPGERPRLWCVGGGPLDAKLKAQSQADGLERDVHWAGERDDPERWLAGADFLVLASNHEGLPYSILEAMRLGLPVVSPSVWGVPEVVDDGVTGILTPPGDAAALGEAVGRLTRGKEERARMGAAGLRRVTETFTRDRMARETESVYAEARAAR